MTENIKTIYVLILFTVAFFFLQMQDPERYVELFALTRAGVMQGEVWRLFTFQFLAGSPIWLFFEILILWIMGSAIEEEIGSARFIAFYLIANFVTAGVGLAMQGALLGSYFAGLALLLVFAMRYPDHVFYIFFVLPVKVKWLALISLGMTLFGALGGSVSSISALAGSAAGTLFVWNLWRPRHATPRSRRKGVQPPVERVPAPAAEENVARFRSARDRVAADRMALDDEIARLSPRVVQGVNICPPRDFKPEDEDRFCAKCEGFAECSIRALRTSVQESERSGD